MHTVADILADKRADGVITVGPLDSVFDALKVMVEHNVGAVIVAIDGFLMGILSERDYARKGIFDTDIAEQTKVSEVMTHDPISVTREDTVVHCIALAQKHRVRHLPVTEQGKAIGMVSLRDLFLDVVHDKFDSDPTS